MQRYQTIEAGVSFQTHAQLVMGTPGSDGMNACVACCDRWAEEDRVALTWFGNDGRQIDLGYRALASDAARFANLLAARGVGPGDVVAGLLPRGAELLTVVLGTWRAGAVFLPIATGADAAAVARRLAAVPGRGTKLVVTDIANRAAFDLVDYCPPMLVVTHGATAHPADGDFHKELATKSSWFVPVRRGADDPFVLLFTESLGHLRPVTLRLRSLLNALSCQQIGIDPRDPVAGWDTNDTGWSFGMYHSVMQPLLSGDAAVAYESDTTAPDADRTVVALPRSQTARVPVRVGGLHAAAVLQLAA